MQRGPIHSLPGYRLDSLTWQEAEAVLSQEQVVVIPLGASCKEHGPHLPLNTDYLLADALANELFSRLSVVITPIVGFSFYPAFVNYPGSVSLTLETASNLLIDIIESYARFGPKRFYLLNTGVSTERPIESVIKRFAQTDISISSTSLSKALSEAETKVCSQPLGSHADEPETSMMLALYPHLVRMDRAVPELAPWKGSPFVRTHEEAVSSGTLSPSGSWGDPTLGTAEKGQVLLSAWLEAMVKDIQTLTQA
jgi:creatinine amidohydrolase